MATSKKKNKLYIRFGFILVLIGVGGLSIPFLSLGFLSDFILLNTLAKEEINDANTVFSSQFLNQNGGINNAGFNNISETKNQNRVFIPKIGVNMAIFTGDSAKLLLKGGWIFPGTGTPDTSTNPVIFGHRFRFLPPASNTFYNLDKLKIGDEFSVFWQSKKYNYKVKAIKVIEPTDFSVLNPSETKQITLITCAPLFSAKQRLVIIGEPSS